MKTKWSPAVISGLLIFLVLSCSKDPSWPDQNPGNARLKQILVYSDIDSKEPIGIVEDYEYDENGRISRTSTPMYNNGVITGTIKYNLYEYNSSDQLVKISNFNANLNSPTGYINLQNFIYEYSGDGKKIRESVENMNGFISGYTDFEYDHNLLVRIKKYSNNILESYIVNQYDRAGRLEKESLYAADDQFLNYTVHNYSGSLQTGSDVYLAKNNEHYRSIKRTFDDNNNLITLESKELSMVSSMMSYVFRYKYFE
jgi:hypothetical protein